MNFNKIAWVCWIVGVGLVCLVWIGSVSTSVQWYGVGIALVGAVLSLLSRGKKKQKGDEVEGEAEKTEQEKAVGEGQGEGGEEDNSTS